MAVNSASETLCLAPAADVVDARPNGARMSAICRLTQLLRVLDVQDVADLQAFAAEPGVGEPAAVRWRAAQSDEEALIDLAHLPRARR